MGEAGADPLFRAVAPGELHKFRTFRLIYPEADEDRWRAFNAQDLGDALAEVIDTLPIAKILVLCRRHPEELGFFLWFFDKSPRMSNELKFYFPYICQNVHRVPIQWIVHHVVGLKDVRYAYQLTMYAFANAVTVNREQLDLVREQTNVWNSFKKRSGVKDDISYFDAWGKLIDLRVWMKELVDFKLQIRLVDYESLKKEEMAKKLLLNCATPTKYKVLLMHDVGKFCCRQSIPLASVIIPTMPLKDWPVSKKLEIIVDFLEGRETLKQVLDSLVYKGDAELRLLKEFAAKNQIEFIPNPNNFVVPVQASQAARHSLTRCPSVEFTQAGESKNSRIGLDMWKKSPSSANLIKKSVSNAPDTMAGLANGEPATPKEYAEKLAKFKEVSEIRPIYELASKHGMVVKLEDFLEIGNKRRILIQLLLSHASGDYGELREMLDMSVDDVVDTVAAELDALKELADPLIRYLSKHVTRGSVNAFLDLLNKAVVSLQGTLQIERICDLWTSCLLDVLDVIDGLKMMFTVETIRVVQAICDMEKANQNEKQKLLNLFIESDNAGEIAEAIRKLGEESLADYVLPTKAAEVTKQAFVNSITSKDPEDVVTALTELPLLDASTVKEFIEAGLVALDGKQYSRLACLYLLLEQRGTPCSKQLSALQILQKSPELTVDFHELLKNPLECLCAVITCENIWHVVCLAANLEIDTDPILIRFMLDVLTSKVFEDYRPFVERLTVRDNPELMARLPEKLKPTERDKFYHSIGYVNLMVREMTRGCLLSIGLDAYCDDSNLDNPKELISVLYTAIPLHETLGTKLHVLTKKIADLNELSITKIRQGLVTTWLNALETAEATDSESIFVETYEEAIAKEENLNIQRALFILRSWKMKNATRFLLKFICSQGPTDYRAKAKAFSCMFSVGSESLIAKSFAGAYEDLLRLHKEMWYRSRLVLFGEQLRTPNICRETVEKVVRGFLARKEELSAGVFPPLFELCLDFEINDKDLLMSIIGELEKTRKRFLMTHIGRLFRVFPEFLTDTDFHAKFILALSAPLDELVTKRPSPLRLYHQGVVSDLLTALATKPVVLDHWVIRGERLPWNEAIITICSAGFSAFATELGSFVVEPDIRRLVLHQLLDVGLYDAAITVGFHTDEIFQYTRKNRLADAIEQMSDRHMTQFVQWLKDQEDYASVEKVAAIMVEQGRAGAAKKLMEEFGNPNV